jgi:energy-coupling factor transporter ATP-binding protein EcfA2
VKTINFGASNVLKYKDQLIVVDNFEKTKTISLLSSEGFECISSGERKINCIDVLENGVVVYGVNTTSGHFIFFYELKDSNFKLIRKEYQKDGKIACLKPLSGGFLATTTSLGFILIWNNDQKLHKIVQAHDQEVGAVVQHSKHVIISGSLDKHIAFTNFHTGLEIKEIKLNEPIRSLLKLPNDYLACYVGIETRHILIYETSNFKCLAKYSANELSPNPDLFHWQVLSNKYFAISGSKQIKIFSLETSITSVKRALNQCPSQEPHKDTSKKQKI